MTVVRLALPQAFKRALVVSGVLHVGLIILIVASPSFSKPPRKDFVQYVNFMGGGGSGGGTAGGPGGAAVTAKTEPLPAAKKPALRDLTVAAKAQPKTDSALRHPTDKPKTSKKASNKTTAITKPEPSAPAGAVTSAAGATSGQQGGSGSGFGLRFGTGGGTGGTGGGTGSGTGDPFGAGNFPFQFYLQMISDKITTNWFQSLVDPGVSGLLQTQVYFRIYKNGTISDVRVDVSSGVETFDLAARRAISNSVPFAPLPNEYDGQYLGITLVFEHAK
ncbi:MAG: TonB family protein [Candidatus Aminicenantes bacterium]|nr:TonB family protein [Candidatus Aminicenantes bacterium]